MDRGRVMRGRVGMVPDMGSEVRPQRLVLPAIALALINAAVHARHISMRRAPGTTPNKDRLFLLLSGGYATIITVLLEITCTTLWIQCMYTSSTHARAITVTILIDIYVYLFYEKNLIRLPRVSQFQEYILPRLLRQATSTDEFALFRGYFTVGSIVFDLVCFVGMIFYFESTLPSLSSILSVVFVIFARRVSEMVAYVMLTQRLHMEATLNRNQLTRLNVLFTQKLFPEARYLALYELAQRSAFDPHTRQLIFAEAIGTWELLYRECIETLKHYCSIVYKATSKRTREFRDGTLGANLQKVDILSSSTSVFTLILNQEVEVSLSLQILSHLIANAAHGDDPLGIVCSVPRLEEIMFLFLSVDEAVLHASAAYEASLYDGGRGPTTVQAGLWGLKNDLWECIERIVHSNQDQMADLRLPPAYVDRLNQVFNAEG